MTALIFPSPFDEGQLDFLDSLFTDVKEGTVTKKKKINKEVRDSGAQFILRRMHPELFATLDRFMWGTNLLFSVQYETAGCEFYQLSQYEEGQFYNWHMDSFFAPEEKQGRERKLSFTLQLTDPDAYEGGDLEFKDADLNPADVRKRGNIVVFHSFMMHRVTPVTQGVRRALVGWYLGEPWPFAKDLPRASGPPPDDPDPETPDAATKPPDTPNPPAAAAPTPEPTPPPD